MKCVRRPSGPHNLALSAGSPRKPDPRSGRRRARLSRFLPALALLLGLLAAVPAQAQETVWSSTLTAKSFADWVLFGTGHTGCHGNSNSRLRATNCAASGLLTDRRIEYEGVNYFVNQVTYTTSSTTIRFTLSRTLPEALRKGMLNISGGGTALALPLSANTTAYSWNASSGVTGQSWPADTEITLSITVPATGPEAPTFSPADGEAETDNTTDITLTFDEAIKADGSNTDFTNTSIDGILTLKAGSSSGSNIGFDATINSAKTQITINPTANLADGKVYVAISNAYYNGAGIQGEAASATFTVDATAPAPTFSPADGETETDNATDITLTFGEAIKANASNTDFTDTSIDDILTLKEDSSGGTDIDFDATINSAKTEITIDPTSNLADGNVYVAISNAYYDAVGNQGSMETATFTVDTTTPPTTLTLSTDAAGDSAAEDAGTVTVTATLDQPADTGRGVGDAGRGRRLHGDRHGRLHAAVGVHDRRGASVPPRAT